MKDGTDVDLLIKKKRAHKTLLAEAFANADLKMKGKRDALRKLSTKIVDKPTSLIDSSVDASAEKLPSHDELEISPQKPVNYFIDEYGGRIEYEKPNMDKLPKIVTDTARVVIKDNFDELD
jgi:hypothetical protein